MGDPTGQNYVKIPLYFIRSRAYTMCTSANKFITRASGSTLVRFGRAHVSKAWLMCANAFVEEVHMCIRAEHTSGADPREGKRGKFPSQMVR